MATGVDKLKSLLGSGTSQSTGNIDRLAAALGKTYTAPQMHTVPPEKKVFLPPKLRFTVPKSETLSDKRNRLQALEQQQAGLPIVLKDYDARKNQLSQEIGTLKNDVKSYYGAADPGPLLAQMGTQTKSPYKEYRLKQREDELEKLRREQSGIGYTLKAEDDARRDELAKEIEAKQAVLDRLNNVTGTEAIDPIFKGLSGFNQDVVTAMFKNPFLKYSPQLQIAKWAGFDAEDKLKNLVNSNTEYFTQKVDQAKEYSGKGYDVYATIAEGVGGALPQAVLAVMSGGTSAAAALPALGGNAGMATAVQTGLTTLAKNPQFLPTFMQSYGSAYNDAIADGATEEQAQLSAIISGLAVSGIEMAGGIQKLPGEVEKGTESFGKALFKTAMEEGAEEPAQGIVQRSVANAVYNPSAPLTPKFTWESGAGLGNNLKANYTASANSPDAVLNPLTAAQEFAGGATVGGILGGGQIAVGKAFNAALPKGNTENGEDIHQLLSQGRQLPEAIADDVFSVDTTVPLNVNGVNVRDSTGAAQTKAPETQSGLISYTPQDVSTFKTGGNNLVDNVDTTLKNFAAQYYNDETGSGVKLDGSQKAVRLYIGRINDRVSNAVKTILAGTPWAPGNVDGANVILKNTDATHIYNEHGPGNERAAGQLPVTPEILSRYGEVIGDPDYVGLSDKQTKQGAPVLIFVKKINGHAVAVEAYSDAQKSLYPKTFYTFDSSSPQLADYINNMRSRLSVAAIAPGGAPASNVLNDTPAAASINTNIPQNVNGVNVQDSMGAMQTASNLTNALTPPLPTVQSAAKPLGVSPFAPAQAQQTQKLNQTEDASPQPRDYGSNQLGIEGASSIDTTIPQNVNGVNVQDSTGAAQTKTQGTQATRGLESYTANEAQNFLTGLKNRVVGYGTSITDFVRSAIQSKGSGEKLYVGKLNQVTANRILAETGYYLSGYNVIMNDGDAWHSYKNHFLKNKKNEIKLTPEAFEMLPKIIAQPDSVEVSPNLDGNGKVALIFTKKIGDTYVTLQGISSNQHALMFDTMYINKEKPPEADRADNGPPLTSKTSDGQASPNDTTVPQNVNGVNVLSSTGTAQTASNLTNALTPPLPSVQNAAKPLLHFVTQNLKEGDSSPTRGDNGSNPQPTKTMPPSIDTNVPQYVSDVNVQNSMGTAQTASNPALNTKAEVIGKNPFSMRQTQRAKLGASPFEKTGIQQSEATSAGKSLTDALKLTTPDVNPLEIDNVKTMLAEEGENIPSNDEADYSFASGLSGKGIAYSKDLTRNLDAAAGGNQSLRAKLHDVIEKPLLEAKARYAQNVRNKLNNLKTFMDKLGIKKGTDESAAVQWIGEGERQDKYGEIQSYSLAQLKEDFPQSWQKIVEAEKYCRKLYDEFIDRINHTLEKIYPNALENAIESRGKKQAEEYYYREQAKVQETLRNEIIRNIEEKQTVFKTKKEGTKVRADLENSMNYNTMRLTKVEEKIDKYFEMAERAKYTAASISADIESGEVLRNKRLLKRKDYYRHYQEIASGFSGLVNLVSTPADIDAKLSGMSEYTQPKTKWAGFMQKRITGKYKEDAIGGLLEYIPSAEYKVNIDPIIANGRAQIKGIAEATTNTRNANRFLEWYTDYINDLAGKTNPFDRPLQKIISRKGIALLKQLNSRVKSNAVLGNMRSAIAQFFNIPNAAAYIKNPVDWAKGMKLFMDQLLGRMDATDLMNQSGFINERYLDSAFSQFDEGIIKAPGKFANWLLTVGDKQATKLIWSSAYEQGARLGKENPVAYADDIAKRSVAGRGIGEVPLAQKSVITQLVAPFQIEVNNSWQLMKEKIAEKDALGLLGYFVVSWLMNSVTRELFGFDVSFDPINALKEGVEDWDEDESIAQNTVNVLGRLGGEALSAMPYGSQIADYIIPDEDKRERIFGDSDPTRYGTGNIGLNMLLKPFVSAASGEDIKDDLLSAGLNILLPFGGKQVERAIKGIPTVSQGGSFTKNSYGEQTMQYPVFNHNPFETAKNYGRAVLFGKSSLPTAQNWVQNDFDTNSVRETAAYQALVNMGADAKLTYDTIQAVSSAQKTNDLSETQVKKNVIQASGLTADQKATLYYELMADKERKEDVQRLIDGGNLTQQQALKIFNTLETSQATDTISLNRAKKNALASSGLTAAQKADVYTELLASTDDKDKIQEYANASGLSPEKAAEVYTTIALLKPEPGKTQVSDFQKISKIAWYKLTDKQTAALVATMYTDSSKDSLLPYLSNPKSLINMYVKTRDSELVSMTIPSEFSLDNKSYTLTASEKRLFKDAYVRLFNAAVTSSSTAEQIKAARDDAYNAAKLAVVNSRN